VVEIGDTHGFKFITIIRVCVLESKNRFMFRHSKFIMEIRGIDSVSERNLPSYTVTSLQQVFDNV
jgi:hypothetical protein